ADEIELVHILSKNYALAKDSYVYVESDKLNQIILKLDAVTDQYGKLHDDFNFTNK
ncbi:13238_t:CDS:1, partial [Funneliformis geosporum]